MNTITQHQAQKTKIREENTPQEPLDKPTGETVKVIHNKLLKWFVLALSLSTTAVEAAETKPVWNDSPCSRRMDLEKDTILNTPEKKKDSVFYKKLVAKELDYDRWAKGYTRIMFDQLCTETVRTTNEFSQPKYIQALALQFLFLYEIGKVPKGDIIDIELAELSRMPTEKLVPFIKQLRSFLRQLNKHPQVKKSLNVQGKENNAYLSVMPSLLLEETFANIKLIHFKKQKGEDTQAEYQRAIKIHKVIANMYNKSQKKNSNIPIPSPKTMMATYLNHYLLTHNKDSLKKAEEFAFKRIFISNGSHDPELVIKKFGIVRSVSELKASIYHDLALQAGKLHDNKQAAWFAKESLRIIDKEKKKRGSYTMAHLRALSYIHLFKKELVLTQVNKDKDIKDNPLLYDFRGDILMEHPVKNKKSRFYKALQIDYPRHSLSEVLLQSITATINVKKSTASIFISIDGKRIPGDIYNIQND
jgi:hypothetical protein